LKEWISKFHREDGAVREFHRVRRDDADTAEGSRLSPGGNDPVIDHRCSSIPSATPFGIDGIELAFYILDDGDKLTRMIDEPCLRLAAVSGASTSLGRRRGRTRSGSSRWRQTVTGFLLAHKQSEWLAHSSAEEDHMRIHHVWPALAAVVMSGSVAFAQSQPGSQQPSTAAAAEKSASDEEASVTLVGCIQREADYRKAVDRGRGGVAGTGLGGGDEFVLINASRAASAAGAINCSTTSNAEAYELTGSREAELKGFVGRAVQITGTMKKAEVKPVGTSGSAETPRPTGGFDPLGQDLQLFEVNVTAFEEVGTLAQATPGVTPAPDAPSAASQSQQSAAPADTQAPATTRPAGKSGAAQPLPDTASPLPLTAVLGLLSLGGAAGVRLLRRR
jgi:hypothetical protein